MNRVYLVAAVDAEMAAKASFVAEIVAKAEKITAIYKTPINGAEAAALVKAGNTAALMEKICADFLMQDFADADVVIVEGATGMSAVVAQKFNEALATALDAKIFADSEDADLFCSTRLLKCEKCIAEDLAKEPAERKTSQAMFRAGLLLKASKAVKRIVLPEGSEPRTVQAACLAVERKIATPVLVGNKAEIEATAKSVGVKLPASIEIIEPSEAFAEKYVPTLVELRKAKGMTEEEAAKKAQDPLYLGCLMIKNGDADGELAGARGTTADTIRPAFQILKTKPGCKIVSGAFLMFTPAKQLGEDGFLIFADCAVNPCPSAEELAQIAVSTAETARCIAGIEPRVAMLSFSTKGSAKHELIDKVTEATRLAHEMAPELMLDGELQADAALIEKVGATKAPGSPVAGKANVLVFPDLQAGNIGYKLVERFSGADAVGPILQGIAAPVNDLSRGCKVQDIVQMVIITSNQAMK